MPDFVPDKLDAFLRWILTLFCALSIGYMLGVDPPPCDPNVEITNWDRIQVVMIFMLFITTGWDWAWYLARKNNE